MMRSVNESRKAAGRAWGARVAAIATSLTGLLCLGCTQPQPPESVAVTPPPTPYREEVYRPIPRPERVRRPPEVPIRTVRVGRSQAGREMTMTIFGSSDRPVFIFGAIHGDEPAGAVVASRLIDELRRDVAPCRTCPVAILPVANPDGLAAGKRTNARGVDLNRNFPARNWVKGKPDNRNYGGASAGSEVETKALIRTIDQLKPRLIITIHAISRGRQCNNYDGPGAEIGRAMAAHNGYPVKASIGYPTPGSFGSWAGIDRKIPVITLELPAGTSGEACWKQNREALLAAIRQSGSS